jgi:hypothetical protein
MDGMVQTVMEAQQSHERAFELTKEVMAVGDDSSSL